MLALFFMMQEPAMADNANVIAAQNAGINHQIKESEKVTVDDAVPADWAGPAARKPGADKNVQDFDPTKTLYTQPNLCVVTAGQPIPECAQTTQVGQEITINGDVFGQSVGGEAATCQMIETIRRDANGNAKKVYATYCGNELGATDYRERMSPTGSEMPTKPTDRSFGPQSTTNLGN